MAQVLCAAPTELSVLHPSEPDKGKFMRAIENINSSQSRSSVHGIEHGPLVSACAPTDAPRCHMTRQRTKLENKSANSSAGEKGAVQSVKNGITDVPPLNPQFASSSERSMNSSLLFLPPATNTPLPPLATSQAPSPAIPLPSSLAPVKPGPAGPVVGLPVPLQPRTQPSSVLPPLRHEAAPGGVDMKDTPQYRKVFVPSTVFHNGVAHQMLVPMMCLVAPFKPSAHASPSKGDGLGSLPPLVTKETSAGTKKAEYEEEPRKAAIKSPSTNQSKSLSAKGGVQKRGQAHYHTRFSSRAAKDTVCKELEACDTTALTLLAEAALMVE